MMQEILLTITMLVSNREETIEKCLHSLSHLMEVVPSELIVVDTAGNEKCMEVVRKYTDKIVRFQWCDDFAVARNAGLKDAKGKWLMFLDDDEWFENTDEIEDFFISGKYKEYKSAMYTVRNYLDKEGTNWTDSMAARMVKREKETCFSGKIHESLTPFPIPRYYMKDYAHHYGYVFQSKEEKLEHVWRNVRPLLERRKENPNDFHAAAQLVQEYMRSGDYFAALQVIKEMKEDKKAWEGAKLGFTAYVAVRELEIYDIQKRYDEAFRVGTNLLKLGDEIPLFSYGSLVHLLIRICYEAKKYEEAVFYIEEFRRIFEIWKSSEKYDKQDLFRVSQNYMVEGELGRFELLKFHIYVLEEKWEKAKMQMLAIDWKDSNLRLLFDTTEDVILTIAQETYEERYYDIFLKNVESPAQKKFMYKAMERLQGEEMWNALSYIYRLPVASLEIYKYQIHYGTYIQDLVRVYELLNEMKEKGFHMMINSPEYWKDLHQCKIPMGDYTESVMTGEWLEIVETLMKNFVSKEREVLYQVLCNGIDKTSFRFYYLTALWMESRILEKNVEDVTWEELYSESLYWMACGGMLYKDEVFLSGLLEAIPGKYQFGWFMMQANTLKQTDVHMFINKVAEAAKGYPLMKEYCKEIMRRQAKEN